VRADRFFDTNILVYAHGRGDFRNEIARALLLDGGMVSVQVLNEFASVARTKLTFTWSQIQGAIDRIVVLCPNPKPLRIETHERALGLCARHGFSLWDGLILAAAIEARCSILLTEDLQHGQVVEGVRIVNPFLEAADV